MSKFKVGDKVNCQYYDKRYKCHFGTSFVGTIRSIRPDGDDFTYSVYRDDKHFTDTVSEQEILERDSHEQK